jgi:uncharacterized membrane protein YkoI
MLNLSSIAVGFVLVFVPALVFSQTPMQSKKISMPDARQIALKAYPGSKIMKEELEHERGGSGLRYSFDLKQGSKWREIGVDAMTGKILENKAEGANPKD